MKTKPTNTEPKYKEPDGTRTQFDSFSLNQELTELFWPLYSFRSILLDSGNEEITDVADVLDRLLKDLDSEVEELTTFIEEELGEICVESTKIPPGQRKHRGPRRLGITFIPKKETGILSKVS